ncbi:hypothetical protein [Streptomyces sp. NPDC060027]|uniref:hypothetical protein n=1 Tax=Streptomyces sp. NPDC060027 TaxID=3347040 RepID=UPI0036941DA4
MRVPRDRLTWRNGNDGLIWDPTAENPKPFNRTVTYEHLDPVVQHWNREGPGSRRGLLMHLIVEESWTSVP